MKLKIGLQAWLIGLVLIFSFCSNLSAAPLKVGAQFGNLKFSKTISEADRAYLGLKKPGAFTLQDIQAKYVLLEILNSNCPHCMEQAPNMNRLYRLVEGSPLKERLKFIGVVNNPEAAVNKWRAAFKVPFPLVSDPDGEVGGTLNITGTPTTVVVDRNGKIIILHDGVFGDPNKAFKELKGKLK